MFLVHVHLVCDHNVWLWVINNLSERKIQKGHQVNLNQCPFPGTAVWLSLYDSGKNSLPPPDSSISPCHGNGWKCQLGEKLAVSPCVVIDIRSCWSKFPWAFSYRDREESGEPEESLLEPTQYFSWQQYVLCWSSVRQWAGRACSFNGRLNECVRCMAFTALFTFLDHMEILQHYILTESSVWFGRERERGGGKEEVVHLCWLCAMSCKVKSQLPYGENEVCVFVSAASHGAGWPSALQDERVCFATDALQLCPSGLILVHLPCVFLKETEFMFAMLL